jgi:AAHS family benzoate transporter-like MFS transporter
MFISGVGLIGSQVLVNAFMATQYPDDLRGPGIGWALAVGRLRALLGPALGGWILASKLEMQWNF